MEIYKLIWDDFCSWYLEMIKPGFEQPISREIYDATMNFFDELMVLLHPMMPFITEEVWQNVKERKEGESIMVAPWPKSEGKDADLIAFGEKMQGLVSGIRNLRSQQGISPKDSVEVFISSFAGGGGRGFGSFSSGCGSPFIRARQPPHLGNNNHNDT